MTGPLLELEQPLLPAQPAGDPGVRLRGSSAAPKPDEPRRVGCTSWFLRYSHVSTIRLRCSVSRRSSSGRLVTMAVEKLTPERRRQLTRDTLLDAAAVVFARRGFHGASLEEIAETAGVTRGALYKHLID